MLSRKGNIPTIAGLAIFAPFSFRNATVADGVADAVPFAGHDGTFVF